MLDRPPRLRRQLEPEPRVELLEGLERRACSVLVADEGPLRVTISIAVDDRVEDPPQQCGLLERRTRLPELLCEPLQPLVSGEGVEVVFPAEAQDACGERRRVPDRDEDVHVEAICEPVRGEERDRILDERPRVQDACPSEGDGVTAGADRVGGRAHRLQLRASVVAERERALEVGEVARLVLSGDEREIALEGCAVDSRRVAGLNGSWM